MSYDREDALDYHARGRPGKIAVVPTKPLDNQRELNHLGGATAIGPILVGMRLPVHVLEEGAEVQDIVNMAAVAVIDAQQYEAASH